MKTFLSIAELQKHANIELGFNGFTEKTKVYHLIQNKGFRILGTPALKQPFESEFIEINGNVTDIRTPKKDAYLFVDININ